MSFFNDLLDSVSGKTNQENYELQLKAQQEQNQLILDLQKKKLELDNSPEAQDLKKIKIFAFIVVFLVAMFFIYKFLF